MIDVFADDGLHHFMIDRIKNRCRNFCVSVLVFFTGSDSDWRR